MFFRCLLLTFLVIVGNLSQASAPSDGEGAFQEGLKLFQEQKYIDAMAEFQKSDTENPDQPVNLYNWGLAAFLSNKAGLAVGLWRRALFLSPHFNEASKALDFAQSKMSSAAFLPPSAGSLEKFKVGLLRKMSLGNVLLLNFLLFVFTGWLSIRYFSKRKQKIEQEEEPPPISFISIGFAILFVASSVLLVIALDFHFENRATSIEQNVSLKTAPQDSANTVFTLLEGSEVIIEDIENDWALATYPGGMTGWIKTSQLYQSNGSRKW